MNTLLSIANGALQYHRGKHTGLAGLFGLAIAVLMVYQWDHVLPVLRALGIIGFFDTIGLIEEEAAITGVNILFFFLKLYLVLSIVAIFAMILTMLLIGFLSSNIGGTIVLGFLQILTYPIVWLIVVFLLLFKKGPNMRRLTAEELKEKGEKDFYDLLTPHVEELSLEKTLNRLNRIPTQGDEQFLLGVTEDLKLYVLLPKPTGVDVYGHERGYFACEEISVKIFDEKTHKYRSYEIIPKHLELKWVDGPIEKLEHEKFVRFFNPTMIDFNRLFQHHGSNKHYREFTNRITQTYLNRKKFLLEEISKELDKPNKGNYNELVEEIKGLNAVNEDFVKMMWDAQNHQEVK
jgi:hypothetical protein